MRRLVAFGRRVGEEFPAELRWINVDRRHLRVVVNYRDRHK